MKSLSFGDLAQSFTLQRRGAALKAQMTRLNEELVSGRVSDVKSVLAGNVSYLTQIENDLRTIEGFRVATTEAGHFADSMQSALERIQNLSGQFSTDLLSTAKNAVGPVLEQLGDDARAEMASVISALNSSVGGRSLFAGAATDGAALADVDTILDGLRVAVGGLANPDDVFTAAQDWFDDPVGFATTAYLGSATSLAPFRIAEGETVGVTLTAEHEAFRDLFAALGVAALSSDGAVGFDGDAKREALDRVGTLLFQNQADLTALRASVGSAQARVDDFATRHAAELTSLAFAKGALLQADPYETATKLEEVQFQLQSLYTVTARMSDLSLVNFLR